MNTSNKNSKVSFDSNRDKYHKWAKGFKKGNNVNFHPYTRIGFEFGKDVNEM